MDVTQGAEIGECWSHTQLNRRPHWGLFKPKRVMNFSMARETEPLTNQTEKDTPNHSAKRVSLTKKALSCSRSLACPCTVDILYISPVLTLVSFFFFPVWLATRGGRGGVGVHRRDWPHGVVTSRKDLPHKEASTLDQGATPCTENEKGVYDYLIWRTSPTCFFKQVWVSLSISTEGKEEEMLFRWRSKAKSEVCHQTTYYFNDRNGGKKIAQKRHERGINWRRQEKRKIKCAAIQIIRRW